MNLLNLIEEAIRAKGSAMELARCMKKAPARITEWKKGRAKPDAGEVAYMAKAAGLPVLITVAMIEAELHPEKAEIWNEALGELKGGRPTPRKEKKGQKQKNPALPGFFMNVSNAELQPVAGVAVAPMLRMGPVVQQ